MLASASRVRKAKWSRADGNGLRLNRERRAAMGGERCTYADGGGKNGKTELGDCWRSREKIEGRISTGQTILRESPTRERRKGKDLAEQERAHLFDNRKGCLT